MPQTQKRQQCYTGYAFLKYIKRKRTSMPPVMKAVLILVHICGQLTHSWYMNREMSFSANMMIHLMKLERLLNEWYLASILRLIRTLEHTNSCSLDNTHTTTVLFSGFIIQSSSVSQLWRWRKSPCKARWYLQPRSRFPVVHILVYTTVNDALWDEIRCRQTGAGEKRLHHAGRLWLGQWQGAACSRGAGSRWSSTAVS